jgi:hypothetical protein
MLTTGLGVAGVEMAPHRGTDQCSQYVFALLRA